MSVISTSIGQEAATYSKISNCDYIPVSIIDIHLKRENINFTTPALGPELSSVL